MKEWSPSSELLMLINALSHFSVATLRGGAPVTGCDGEGSGDAGDGSAEAVTGAGAARGVQLGRLHRASLGAAADGGSLQPTSDQIVPCLLRHPVHCVRPAGIHTMQ